MEKLNLNLDAIEKMSERELSQVYGGASDKTTNTLDIDLSWGASEGIEVEIDIEW